jgi:tyrosine-protein phosphatase YwqE
MGSTVQTSSTRLVDANSGMLSLSSDGSVNWPRTLRLAEFAYHDDVERVIVTAPYSCIDVLHRRLPHLTSLLSQHRVPMEIAPAIEFSLSRDLFDRVVHTSLVFGGPVRRYVFLRIPSDCRLPVSPVVESLQRMNLTPILLAPERCDRFRENDSELRQIVSGGGMIQLSAASLLDQTDAARIRLCRHLIRKNLCHLVATESGRHHDLPISLRDAYQVILRWSGQDVSDAVCCHNPSRVFDGKSVEATPQRRSVMKIFSRAA